MILIVTIIINLLRGRRARRAEWDHNIGRHIERMDPDEERRSREYRAYMEANPGGAWIEFKDWDRP